MKIALTYDLRDDYLAQGFSLEETAEFDSIETIDALDETLTAQGFEVERIGNIKQLAQALCQGKCWELVFNIAEGMHGIAREAQIPALLDAYKIPYIFSDPVSLSLALDKSLAKRIVRDHGIPTAAFTVVKSLADLHKFSLPFPVFIKPLAEGTGKGITEHSCIDNVEKLRHACADLLHRFQQPVLVECFLPGREFTVGIVGHGQQAEVIGVMEIVLGVNAEKNAYSFQNKEFYEGRVSYKLAQDQEARKAGEIALQAWVALNCRDAGRIDLRSNHLGIPQFMEVNPIAGLHPIRSDLIILMRMCGYNYTQSIDRIMKAGLKRLGFLFPSDRS